MKNINKAILALISLFVISNTLIAASDEMKFFPIFTDENWKAKVEVAAVSGHMDFQGKGVDSGAISGIELSFECPVFTIPGENTIRQQLELSQYDKNGLRITTIEMNPYYHINLSDNLVWGFGPGIGAMNADADGNKDQWLFTVQAGTGLKYYMGDIILGADIRYQWTAEKDIGSGSKQDLDNTRFLLKVGYRF